jgi:hypothetical protein
LGNVCLTNLRYMMQLKECPLPPHSMVWKHNRRGNELPKVNIFYWTMVHERLPTTKNLHKCEIQGPLRCALYRVAEETQHHLFFECLFSKHVWKFIFDEIDHRVALPLMKLIILIIVHYPRRKIQWEFLK